MWNRFLIDRDLVMILLASARSSQSPPTNPTAAIHFHLPLFKQDESTGERPGHAGQAPGRRRAAKTPFPLWGGGRAHPPFAERTTDGRARFVITDPRLVMGPATQLCDRPPAFAGRRGAFSKEQNGDYSRSALPNPTLFYPFPPLSLRRRGLGGVLRLCHGVDSGCRRRRCTIDTPFPPAQLFEGASSGPCVPPHPTPPPPA